MLRIKIEDDCTYKVWNDESDIEVFVPRYEADYWAKRNMSLIIQDDEIVDGVRHAGTIERNAEFGEFVHQSWVEHQEIKNMLIALLFH